MNTLLDQLEVDVNNELPNADQSNYLKGMSNAGVMSGKGSGTDYANPIDIFLIGYTLGAGADLGDNSIGDLIGGDIDGDQFRGAGFQFSLMLGIDGGVLPFKSLFGLDNSRTDYFINWNSKDSSSDNFTFTLKSFGLHVRYQWLPGG